MMAHKMPSKVSIAKLMKFAAAHYHLQPWLAVQRFRFNSWTLQGGESVAAYLAELNRLSEDCNFGDTLDEVLQDRIVYGFQDQRTQSRLLEEPKLMLKKAFEVAQSIESVGTQVEELQHPCMAALHAVGLQFQSFCAQVPQGTLVDDCPSTPTHCDPSFTDLSRATLTSVHSPLHNAELRSKVPLRSHRPHDWDADKCTGHRNANFVKLCAIIVASVDTSSLCANLLPAPCAPDTRTANLL